MPKIIDNLREKLLEEARRQIMEDGYGNVNIRSIAAGCGVGVGTVYNYFPSKDALIAGFLIKDWNECLNRIRTEEAEGASAEDALRGIYTELNNFYEEYRELFHSPSVKLSAPPKQYHVILRKQIAQLIRPYCSAEAETGTPAEIKVASPTEAKADSPAEAQADFTADFAAEALLTWTIDGRPFEDIYRLLAKVI